LYLFLVDPRRAADASLTVECAGRSLEYVAEKFHQAGKHCLETSSHFATIQ
jgi:hypothetical protein